MYVPTPRRPVPPDNNQQSSHRESSEATASPGPRGGEIEIPCGHKLTKPVDFGFALLLLTLLFIPMLVNRYLA